MNENKDKKEKEIKRISYIIALFVWIFFIASAYLDTMAQMSESQERQNIEQAWEELKLSGTGILIEDDYIFTGTTKIPIEAVTFEDDNISSGQYHIWIKTGDIVDKQSHNKRNVIIHETTETTSYIIESTATYLDFSGITSRNVIELYLTTPDLERLMYEN